VCDVNVQYFPFDEQTCKMTFYVSGESLYTLEFDHFQTVDMSEYSENPEWVMLSATRTRYVRDNNYNVELEFRLRRRADFTAFTLVAPLLMLAFLNICVFLVPSDCGEKGTFSITVFLAYSVYLSIISETLPHNSVQLSFFVVFIIVLLCMSVVSVFYTIIQAKMCSQIAKKECPITIFRKKQDINRVQPVGDDGPENTTMYTWTDFFQQLDSYVFGVFFVGIVVVTGIFFAVLMKKAATDEPPVDIANEATTRSMPFVTTATP